MCVYVAALDCANKDIQRGPKSKPLPNDQKIVLNRVKACK